MTELQWSESENAVVNVQSDVVTPQLLQEELETARRNEAAAIAAREDVEARARRFNELHREHAPQPAAPAPAPEPTPAPAVEAAPAPAAPVAAAPQMPAVDSGGTSAPAPQVEVAAAAPTPAEDLQPLG